VATLVYLVLVQLAKKLLLRQVESASLEAVSR